MQNLKYFVTKEILSYLIYHWMFYYFIEDSW